jgi:AcrR family transcriptional regulator
VTVRTLMQLEEGDNSGGHRRRDAGKTRQLLLDAARRRFAREGYAAATVREIADDAGVNVALISRYFDSKEGLFEACLAAAVEELSRGAGDASGLAQVPEAMARQLVGTRPEEHPDPILLLLLRSSGDERAEALRLEVLRTFATRLASAAGWQPDRPGAEQIVLRAQLVLAASIGIAVLRSSPGLEPLASATEQDLIAPLRVLVEALLSGDQMSPT